MLLRSTVDDTPPPLLVTEEEAAGILRISKRLLWSLNAQGIIPCVRLAGAKRYSYAELEKFVQSQSDKSASRR